MTTAATTPLSFQPAQDTTAERGVLRWLLIVFTVGFLGVFLILPVADIFYEALREGAGAYFAALKDPDTLHAVWLTVITAGIAVPLNMVFGVAAAWCLTKFDFFGKGLLLTLIDLPFAVSPVVAGLIFVLLFGQNGWLGAVVARHDLHVIFNTPGIVLATIFVTFPFVARELIPLMQAQGTDEEVAARVLGAGAWRTFFRVTLPNIRWGLLYGLILCNARAMGEFGAVYVVSGSIRGQTCTLPLQVDILYQDNYQAAFAVASMLALLAVVTLVLKELAGWKTRRTLAAAAALPPAGAEPGLADREPVSI